MVFSQTQYISEPEPCAATWATRAICTLFCQGSDIQQEDDIMSRHDDDVADALAALGVRTRSWQVLLGNSNIEEGIRSTAASKAGPKEAYNPVSDNISAAADVYKTAAAMRQNLNEGGSASGGYEKAAAAIGKIRELDVWTKLAIFYAFLWIAWFVSKGRGCI